MSKIIFRSPFVTSKRMKLAKHYLDLSESILHQAECIKNTSTASDDYTRLIFRSTDCMLKGAKYAGFRSISDMKKYIDIHGKL